VYQDVGVRGKRHKVAVRKPVPELDVPGQHADYRNNRRNEADDDPKSHHRLDGTRF